MAAMVFEGGADVAVMRAFAEGDPQTILRIEGIVAMDDLWAHKYAGVIAALEAAGAIVCFLPPFSPDLDPIEKRWSEVKEIRRSAKTRTADALLEAIGMAPRAVTIDDAEGRFAHRGYGNTESLAALIRTTFGLSWAHESQSRVAEESRIRQRFTSNVRLRRLERNRDGPSPAINPGGAGALNYSI
jgi:transposase